MFKDVSKMVLASVMTVGMLLSASCSDNRSEETLASEDTTAETTTSESTSAYVAGSDDIPT